MLRIARGSRPGGHRKRVDGGESVTEQKPDCRTVRLRQEAESNASGDRDSVSGDISVVITTHFRNETLQQAIESSLAQTVPPRQVLVVDDSGERHAEPVATDYDVSYLAHAENRGQIAAWHTGFAAAEGRYVQLLDDDDVLHETKLAAQLELLEDHSAAVAYCGFEWSDGERVMPPGEARGDVLERVLTLDFPVCTTSTLLIERRLLEAVFPLRAYGGGTDLPLKIELATLSPFEYVDRPLVSRRKSPNSQGRSMVAMRARHRILDDYEELYAEVPPEVRQRAAAMSHRLVAAAAMQNQHWSAEAIACYFRAALADPSTRRYDMTRGLLAVLGRPGLAAGRHFADCARSLRGSLRSTCSTRRR